jgi:hypothetical protein
MNFWEALNKCLENPGFRMREKVAERDHPPAPWIVPTRESWLKVELMTKDFEVEEPSVVLTLSDWDRAVSLALNDYPLDVRTRIYHPEFWQSLARYIGLKRTDPENLPPGQYVLPGSVSLPEGYGQMRLKP